MATNRPALQLGHPAGLGRGRERRVRDELRQRAPASRAPARPEARRGGASLDHGHVRGRDPAGALGLAKGFAVCDGWFASVPTQTFPNRAFAVAGTSLGYVDNSARGHPCLQYPLGVREARRCGTDVEDLRVLGRARSRPTTSRTRSSPVRTGKWSRASPGSRPTRPTGRSPPSPTSSRSGHAPRSPDQGADDGHNFHVENDQHPVSNLAVGEKLLYDVYQALRSNGPAWAKTLLIITYDEHGGNYDHVHPPTGAIAPDGMIGPSGFDFTRFGVRVPAVIVSPLIPAGTILRAPERRAALRPHLDHRDPPGSLRRRRTRKARRRRTRRRLQS